MAGWRGQDFLCIEQCERRVMASDFQFSETGWGWVFQVRLDDCWWRVEWGRHAKDSCKGWLQ